MDAVKGTDSTTVLHDLDDQGVLTLTLHRPERNNAYTVEMETALHDLFEQAAEDPAVRAIVLTGHGRSFCPGLDSEDLTRATAPGGRLTDQVRRPITYPTRVPLPIICAINGACAGLGLATAMYCDIRFMSAGAKLTTAYARRGLPAESAMAWLLPRLVGHATALDLLLSGRVVEAEEALAIGLVHRVVPPEELLAQAQAYATDVAVSCSPLSMATAKAQVYEAWEASLEESRRHADREIARIKPVGDSAEGVASFIEKRRPRFADLSLPIAAPLEA